MAVRIIYGAIGSGKSRRCLDEIEKIHNENPSARCIMLIPDHYSYEAEKQAVERFGGIGLNNIEVLTLKRMAINTLTQTELNHLTEAGRQMLIYKAVSESCDELQNEEDADMRLLAAMRRRGFLDVASSLISEMKRYLVEPSEMSEKADMAGDNKTLRNKLTAFSRVYGKYTEFVEKSGFSDGENDLSLLAEHIERDGGYDDNTYVWVDRFDFYLPQQLSVIEALLKCGVNMTMTSCYPANGSENERELYARVEKSYSAAVRLQKAYGGTEIVDAGKGLSYLRDRPDLYKLLSRFNVDFEYDSEPLNISLFQSRDNYGEIERIAARITDMVRGGGYRYRDIALMCGDESEYINLIEAVFAEYNIPYFADRKIILSDHPIALQILSLFDILEEDWSYESVFRYLRAGFIYRKTEKGAVPLNQDEVDTLENFVLRCGIRGGKRWLGEEPWLKENGIMEAAFGDEADAASERIDELRREIAAPIQKFAAAVKGKNTALTLATALFEYLEDINLYKGLNYEVYKFRENGMLDEADRFAKIWNLILDVLNQVTFALADDKITAEEFAEYISVGLGKCEIRIIPSGIDQVYVGSAERVSRSHIRAMFLVGAHNGTFPSVIKTEGFFSDRDRNTLSEDMGITIAPDTKQKTGEQYFKVYRALCAVTDKLFISYSIQNKEGKEQNAAHMLLEIKRKFPKLRVTDNLTQKPSEDFVYISSPKATLHRLMINYSDRYEGGKNMLWDIVMDWYKSHSEWRQSAELMDRADYYSRRGVLLDGDVAALLYDGRIKYSASRINTFSACPFEYFLKYGLGAKKRAEWEVTPADMGSYAHRVINEFCVEVEKGAVTNDEKIAAWRGLSEKRRGEIIGKIIDETCANMLSSPVRDKERTASIFRRMGKTIASAAALVQKSLSAGSYAENGMELEFDTDISENVSLKGIVDRVDTCETDGERYMRIVDYKTGRTVFDIVNIFNGYDMQMVIYALAMRESLRESGGAEVSGIYYTGVKSEYREVKNAEEEKNIREIKENELVLDGVTFADEDEEKRLHMLEKMESGFTEKGESTYTNVYRNDEGEIVSVHSNEAIDGLMEFVKGQVKDIDARTRSGDISITPYDTNGRGGVCTYCDYASVCRFDERHKVMREKKGDEDEIWEIMKTKGVAVKGVKADGKVDESAGESDI